LENLSNDEDVDRTWGNIKENIKTSAKESLRPHILKQNKLWFDEESLGLLKHRKRAKMQWILGTSQNKLDNPNSVRREVRRHFRNKKKACLRAKFEEYESNSKIQNIRVLYRGINDIKKGYQPRCNIVKDKKGNLVADSHSNAERWRNYFSQLFNVHGVKDVVQTEIHTAQPLVPDPSASEFELAFDKLKRHNSPGFHQIPAELIKVGCRSLCLEIYKLITSIWKREKLPEGWKESIIVPIHKKGYKTDCNNYRGISLLPTTYKILSNIMLSRLIPYAKEIIGVINVAFEATGRLLIIYSAFAKYLRKNGSTMKKFISSS